MIHKFTIDNKNLVLDVNSNSLYEMDKSEFDLCGENGLLAPNNELQELIINDKLYSKNDYEEFVPKERGEVKALCLNIAHDCNLRCKYCFADGGEYQGKSELMSFEVAKKAIDFLISNSGDIHNLEVDFFGGEPLMNWEVVKETVEYGDGQAIKFNKNIRWTLTTNGILLDDEKIEFINEHMSNLVLSLDGRKEINDEMRGKGGHEKIVPKFQNAVRNREKDYYIRGTYTAKNLDFLEDVKHIYELGFKNISMEPMVGDFEWAIKDEHLERIKAEYEKLAKFVVENDINYFHFMLPEHSPCIIKRLSGCGAGCEYLAIAPNGDVYSCHQFVGQNDKIVGKLESGVTKHFPQKNIYTNEKCVDCWVKFYCCGGCQANQTDITCEIMRKRTECALWVKSLS